MGLKGAILEELMATGDFSWNQTKMGLKVTYPFTAPMAAIKMLKSDQNGIESFTTSLTSISPLSSSWNQTKMGLKAWTFRHSQSKRPSLKSDQNGIESSLSFSLIRLTVFVVEIRPKWDWKFDVKTAPKLPVRVEIRPKWDWKILTVGVSFPFNFGVEIRPKWDWKHQLMHVISEAT